MKNILEQAINNEGVSKLPSNGAPQSHTALTTANIRNILNNVCSGDNVNYLEIGLYRGATFSAALYNNNIRAVGIDNWSQDFHGAAGPKEEFFEVYKNFKGKNQVKIIEKDCWKVEPEEVLSHFDGDKVNVYFFDGPHGYQDQYDALDKYLDVLDDEFVLFVDDYNETSGADVIRATQDAIRDLNLKIVTEYSLFGKKYWEGLYAAVLKKSN